MVTKKKGVFAIILALLMTSSVCPMDDKIEKKEEKKDARRGAKGKNAGGATWKKFMNNGRLKDNLGKILLSFGFDAADRTLELLNLFVKNGLKDGEIKIKHDHGKAINGLASGISDKDLDNLKTILRFTARRIKNIENMCYYTREFFITLGEFSDTMHGKDFYDETYGQGSSNEQ